jgi:dihydroxy-acid dehydratase
VNKLNWRSHQLTGGERIASEAFLAGLGLTQEQFGQAQVAIGVPWLHGNLCNTHTPQLAEIMRVGCGEAGVVGMPFGLPGVSDAISMGHPGMRMSLVSRGLLADAIEMVCEAHLYDAFVGVHACDKNGPGAIMAMARMNIPSLLVSGGTILPGCHNGEEITIKNAFAAAGLHRVGRMDRSTRDTIVRKACPGPGGCGAMYTFNTMGCTFEAMGLTLPYSSSIPAVDPLKQRECEQVGSAIKLLLEADIRPLQLLTKSAFINGIVTAAAIGGSTNVVLHLLAIAQEAGVDLKIEEFQEIFRRTPVIANFAPRGPKSMVDLHRVGGTPALLKVLLAEGLIDGDILTVTGKTLRQNLESLPELSHGQDVVAVGGKFFKDSADLQIVFGTLAPGSAVFKVPFDQTRWTGPARVFNGEADMVKAVAQGDIKPGDIVIIRYVGPKGAPGMPEMLEPSSAISSVPELNGQVVLITDARYSGVSGGAIGGHVCPEAFEPGSPISLVENGDPIVLDLQAGLLDLDVAPHTLAKRKLSVVTPPDSSELPRILRTYRRSVGSARHGCPVD